MSITLEPLATTTAASRNARGADLALLFGRAALVAIYLISGIGMAGDLGMLQSVMRAGGVPVPALFAVGIVAIELGAAIAILIGWQVRVAALALVGLTLVATLLSHPFWAVSPLFREDQFAHFMKNLGLMGGLLLLAATGPGRLALSNVMVGTGGDGTLRSTKVTCGCPS